MNTSSKKNHHVALFIPTLGGGGAEKVMIMLANSFAERGLKVDLITGNGAGPFTGSISQQVNTVDLGVTRLLWAIPSFVRYLRAARPDVVLSAIGHANVLNVFLTRKFSPQSRVVVSVHGSLTADVPKNPKSYFVNKIAGIALSKADYVVAVSNGIRNQVLRLHSVPPERVTTIYNPLDIDSISTLATDPAGHDWVDNSTLPVVIGIGRFTAHKNFELLIRSFAEVVKVLPARLVILGDGEERERLENLVEDLNLFDSILLPGFVENPFAWLSKSDVFVLSSNSEGLPGVLLEALACGVKVVSTDCETGPDEILEHGKWGTLTPVGDVRQLAKAIVRTLQNDDLVNTRERACDFSTGKAVSRYLDILLK